MVASRRPGAHPCSGDKGARGGLRPSGLSVQCKILPLLPPCRWDPGSAGTVLQGEPCRQCLLHSQHLSRGPFSKNTKCGTAFAPRQGTKMSLKQNPPSLPGSTNLEGAQAGHLCLAVLAPSNPGRSGQAWQRCLLSPQYAVFTAVRCIHLQASSCYRNEKKVPI